MDIGSVIIFLACIFAVCLEAIFEHKNSRK
jgi:hypothetical protein